MKKFDAFNRDVRSDTDEFPGAVHLVSDEYEQVSAEALEAARVTEEGGRGPGLRWVPDTQRGASTFTLAPSKSGQK